MKASTDADDRIGLYGGFWTRFLLRLLSIFPAWFCAFMARPLAMPFYLLAARQRTALSSNLRALHPGLSPLGRWWGGYRVFVQFALTYLDRLWALHFGRPVAWEFQGGEWLQRQLESPGGVLLFTVHSGNYDLGAAFFAQYFPRSIHVIRVAERSRGLQEVRTAEVARSERQSPRLKVHYAADEWNLGLELARLLAAGEVVAVQGDRVLSATPPLQIDLEGIRFTLPRGPLLLAQISRVPCFPILLTRLGRGRYCIHTGPPFHHGKPGARLEEIALAWGTVMADFVRHHWDQWYVFEPVLARPKPPPSNQAGPAGQTVSEPCA